MSLTVPPALLEQARQGDISDAEFVDCIRTSLPYAWSVVTQLVERLNDSDSPAFVDNQAEPPDESARGQLLRMVGSDAMRAAIERHFNVRLAFQNCHRLALFKLAALTEHSAFVTPRAQVLNQTPELVNC